MKNHQIVALFNDGVEVIENYTPAYFQAVGAETYIGKTKVGSLGTFYFLYERTTGGALPHTRVYYDYTPIPFEINPEDTNGFKTIKALKLFYEKTNIDFEAARPRLARMTELVEPSVLKAFVTGTLAKVIRAEFMKKYGVTR